MRKRSLVITVLIGLVIAGLMVVACDGDDDGTPTATTVSPTPTYTSLSTPTPTASLTPTPGPTTVSPTPTHTATSTPTPSPSSTSTSGPTVTPTPPASTTPEPAVCETDRVAIQAALDSYHAVKGTWPTADGKPGLIDWAQLVPDFMAKQPTTTACKWQVNADPEGQVCRSAHC